MTAAGTTERGQKHLPRQVGPSSAPGNVYFSCSSNCCASWSAMVSEVSKGRGNGWRQVQSDSQQPGNGGGKSRVDLPEAAQSPPPNTAAIYSKRRVTPQGCPGGSVVKNLPPTPGTWVRSLGQEDPLEKGMATRASILA